MIARILRINTLHATLALMPIAVAVVAFAEWPRLVGMGL